MPEYGQSPWDTSSGPMQGLGQSMSALVLGQNTARYHLQQLQAQIAWHQMQNALLQQRLQSQDVLNRARADYFTRRGGQEDALAQSEQQKAAMQQAQMIAAQRAGRLQGYQNTPNLMQMVQDQHLDPTTGAMVGSGPQIMEDLRASGVAPQGQFNTDQAGLMMAVNAALRAQGMQQAMSTPDAAQRFMRPQTLNPGQQMVDPITPGMVMATGTGTKPMSEYENQRLAIDKQRNQYLAQRFLTPEQQATIGLTKAIMGQMGKQDVMSDKGNVGKMSDLAKTVLSGMGFTNNAFGGDVTSGVGLPHPNPTMRKIGDTVQTAKGVFRWNGGGWDPVSGTGSSNDPNADVLNDRD